MIYTRHTAKARNKLELIGTKRLLINGRYELEDISKHSFNIIDLIECGDYVNEVKVIHVLDGFSNGTMEIELSNHRKIYRTCVEDIKSIVTHEQFNSIKYEVK